MKKIILIEDRPERMNMVLGGNGAAKLKNYRFLDIKTGRDFDEIKNLMDNFEQVENCFQNYIFLMCHRSAFDENVRILLQRYCQAKKKCLVLFSGNISQSTFQDLGYPLLSLNSKSFFSENLFLFLDDFKRGRGEPLILLYGHNWQISLLLTLRDKMNQLILYRDKSTRNYIDLENGLRVSLKSSFERIGISFDIEDWSQSGKGKMKDEIDKIIDEKFAFEL